MYWLKQCPKCNGDLTTGRDQYGEYMSCMQCGLCKDIQVETLASPFANRDSQKLTVATVTGDEGYRLPALHPQQDLTQVAVPA